MIDDSFENQLPEDLRRVADALRESRATADGHLLERALHRLSAVSRPRPRWRLSPLRASVAMTLAVVCVIGSKVAHVNVVRGVAVLAGSVTKSSSTSPTGSAAVAAVEVYCGSGSGTGTTGWAPSFRWHYGLPNVYDNGWSASVQPSCPSGSLTISLVDNIIVTGGSTIDVGYDFHAANKPAFTLMTLNPQAVLNLKCSNGTTHTVTAPIVSGTYHSPANTPDWIPTGDKNSTAGFQGTVAIPAVCGAGKPVTVLGGTFTTTVKIT